MNLAFLVIANAVLLARLVCFFRDEPLGSGAWVRKTVFELGVLLVFFEFSLGWMLAVGWLILGSLAGAALERRSSRRPLARAIAGAIELAGLSLIFSPALAVHFHSWGGEVAFALRNWSAVGRLLETAGAFGFQLFLFGLLWVANEANLVIRAAFDWLDLKPRAARGGDGVVDVGELNRGRVIGILERGLLYSFVLQGQFGAIGFVLAAKAFTRFKALDDRSFAEYVLIGTLLSASLALSVGAVVRFGLVR